MDAIDILLALYAINGIIAVGGYWPQIVKLYKIESQPRAFSIPGWSLWVYTTVVTFSYATLINGDKVFMLVSGMYFLGTFSIWSLAVYKNWKYRPTTKFETPSEVDKMQ